MSSSLSIAKRRCPPAARNDNINTPKTYWIFKVIELTGAYFSSFLEYLYYVAERQAIRARRSARVSVRLVVVSAGQLKYFVIPWDIWSVLVAFINTCFFDRIVVLTRVSVSQVMGIFASEGTRMKAGRRQNGKWSATRFSRCVKLFIITEFLTVS